MSRKTFRVTLFTLSILSLASQSMGSGFGIFTQSATGLGKANSVSAHHDEPSAVFFNPALMSKIPGTQMEMGTTMLIPDREVASTVTSLNTETEHQIFFPSTFYATHTLSERFSAGIAVYSPFGLATKWPVAWEGRYLATKSELTSFNINPALAWKLHPRFTVAAGLDLVLVDSSIERKINTAPFGDSNQKFEGNGQAWGYNLGLLVDLADAWSLGASYRSRVTVDVKGDLSFHLANSLLAPTFPDTKAETELPLPDQFTSGLAWRTTDRLTVEAGVRWEGWGVYDQVKLVTALPVAGTNIITESKHWKDTWAYTLGFDYKLTPEVRLLAGYLYGDDAVPDDTFEPGVPDSPAHLFTVGFKWQGENWGVGGSYGYQHQEDRGKHNSLADPVGMPGTSANGEYRTSMHLMALSAIYRF